MSWVLVFHRSERRGESHRWQIAGGLDKWWMGKEAYDILEVIKVERCPDQQGIANYDTRLITLFD